MAIGLAPNGAYLVSGTLNNEDVASATFNSLAYPTGQLGKLITLSDAMAARFSYSTNTLFAGVYQCVQFLSTSTAANLRGGAVFWQSRASFIVTPDATAVTEADFAGVGLMVNTKGNFGWIQVAGKAGCLYRATVTDKNVSNLVLQLTTTNTFDAIADATGTYVSGGVKGIKNIVGQAITIPADGAIATVAIWPRNLNFG